MVAEHPGHARQARDQAGGEPSAATPLRFGILLLPHFTLAAFGGFVDVLRLASDEGDRSRPLRCNWSIIGETLQPVRASCGVGITPTACYDDAARDLDYLVVVGGLLHTGRQASEATLRFIREAAAGGCTLVGLCTGVFALTRAGVLDSHRVCVSWFHYWDFVEQFPRFDTRRVVSDRLYVVDGNRITCSGGRATIDVAAAILQRHLDVAVVQKALRILLVDSEHRASAAQPMPHASRMPAHPALRRAVLLMEQHLARPLGVDALAARLGISKRQLERRFRVELGCSPSQYNKLMRLRVAAWMLQHSDRGIAHIALSCGFADASHLGRDFRSAYAVSPGQYRERAQSGMHVAPTGEPVFTRGADSG